ncbi:HlyD family efflux transporter periplasmic adaptor subunit [Pseudoalteromonas sp. SIMBA_153]
MKHLFITPVLLLLSLLTHANNTQESVISTVDSLELGSFVGTVTSQYKTNISAIPSGLVVSTLDKGAQVRQGDVIAILENKSLLHEFESIINEKAETKVQLDFYFLKLKRLKQLQSHQSISIEEVLELELKIDILRHELKKIKSQVKDYEYLKNKLTIRAPYDAIVVEKVADVGQWINKSDTITKIKSNNRFRLQLPIPITYLKYFSIEGAVPQVISHASEQIYQDFTIITPTNENEVYFTLVINQDALHEPEGKERYSIRFDNLHSYQLPVSSILALNGKKYLIIKQSGEIRKIEVEQVRYSKDKAIIISPVHIVGELVQNPNGSML